MTLRDEVVELLQALIRLDTVNPPGNETRGGRAAARVPRAVRRRVRAVRAGARAGEPRRADPAAAATGRALLLLSHTDTVLADPAEWSVDPWSGELRDGCVWGRGALDMKGQVAASAVAIASLAREGFQPAGDLIFAATADEEVGEGVGFGLAWLCEAHPEAVRCDYAVNEGAGDRVEIGGRVLYLCSPAEKMRLAVHAARPRPERPRLDAGDRGQRARQGGAADRAARRAFAAEPRADPGDGGLPRGRWPTPCRRPRRRSRAPARSTRSRPRWSSRCSAMTVSPTMIAASQKRNVIPGRCEVTVDCRLLPGQTQAEADGRRCGRGSATATTSSSGATRQGGTRSELGTPLWSAIEAFVDGDRAGRAAGADLRRRASPTATGCARRSGRSRTGSSRCGRWAPSWPRG